MEAPIRSALNGQIVYFHDGTLLAAPFDVKHLAVTGNPVTIMDASLKLRAPAPDSLPSRKMARSRTYPGF